MHTDEHDAVHEGCIVQTTRQAGRQAGRHAGIRHTGGEPSGCVLFNTWYDTYVPWYISTCVHIPGRYHTEHAAATLVYLPGTLYYLIRIVPPRSRISAHISDRTPRKLG